MQASTDRMISVSISDVVFNSASRLLFSNNKFQFDETFATDILAVSATGFCFSNQNVNKLSTKSQKNIFR